MITTVLRNTQALLSVVFSAGYADSTVTTTITRADGTVLSTGLATKDLAVTGRYTYTLAPQANVAELTVNWAGTFGGVDQSLEFPVSIIGAHLFTIAEARAFGDRILSNTAAYPDADIIDSRERITDFFQWVCGVSFVPRYSRVTLDGTDREAIFVPHAYIETILDCTIDGVTLTAGELADIFVYPEGRLVRRAGWRRDYRNITVGYDHGYRSAPGQISREAMRLARYDLTNDQLADRFISMSADLGVIRTAVATPENPTAIPVIDAALRLYSKKGPPLLVH